uniref:Reverse transcriptase zinc-binding domain-containing protein n=1 Tax=Quercus lobata TaxID=97700 RepID=A0A7N2LRG7_QUELO
MTLLEFCRISESQKINLQGGGAKNIIAKGACYLIGDGASINVWLDPWVPWLQGFTPKPLHAEFANTPMMVSMLFDSETHSWKESLIHQIFEPESAAAILSLPIPTRPCSDKLIWVPDSRGEFSVKSAYRSSRELENSGIMSDVLWRRLWKIRAPERIKMLLWRIAPNSLPTRHNISLRTHIPDPSCSLCGHASESTCHIFFHCPVAKAIWFSCWGLRTEDHNIQECADLVKLILDPPWQLDLIVNNGVSLPPWRLPLTKFGFPETSLCFMVCRLTTLPYAHVFLGSSSEGSIKVNVDATVTSTTTALAVVARDHHGNPIKVWMKQYCLFSPIQAEAAALLWAAQLASLEGMAIDDAFQAVALIEKLPPSWKEYRNYLKHKKRDTSLEDLIVHIRIEESNQEKDKSDLASEFSSKANLVE